MSEKNEIEVIYVNVPNLTFLDRIKNFGADVLCVTTDEQLTQYSIPYIIKSKYDELSLENARLAADIAILKAELEKVKESKEYKHTIKCSLPELTEKQKEQLSQLTKEATHVLTIDLNGHHIMQTIEEYNQQNKPTK